MRLAPRAALLAVVVGIPLGTVGTIYALVDEAPAPTVPAGVRIESPPEPEVRPSAIQPIQPPTPIESRRPTPPAVVEDDDDDRSGDDD